MWDIIHPESQQDCREVFARVLAGESLKHVQATFVSKSGNAVVVEGDASGRFADGEIVSTQSFFRDVTEQRRAEELLRQNETRHSATLDALPDLMFRVNDQGVYLDFRAGDVSDLAAPPEEIIGNNIRDVLPPDLAEKVMDYVRKAIDSQSIQELEFQLPLPKGAQDFEARITPSGPDEVVTIVRNITERKQREEALREQMHRNEQILQTTMDGYILADTEGRLIDVNPAYCETVGYSREELVTMNIRELEMESSPEEVERRIAFMVERGWDRFETQHRRKDGRIVDLDVSIVIMRSAETPLVAAFVRDITERKQTQEQLEGRLRELEALNRLFQSHLQQQHETEDAYSHLANSVMQIAEQFQDLAKEAETRRARVEGAGHEGHA